MDTSTSTPTLDSIDDPHGIPGHILPDDVREAAEAFIEQVQEIRWELWALLGSLDNTQVVSTPAARTIIAAIDDLGVAVRAEAACLDGVDPDPAELWLEASMRRFYRQEDSVADAA